MIDSDKPNPFFVLKLPTNATQADIVNQSEELHILAQTGEEDRLISWAAEQLRTNQRIRLEYELFELPETRYTDENWEMFVNRHRRRETALPPLLQDMDPPGLEDLNLAALTELLLEEALTPGEPDIEQAINGSPLVPRYTLPLKEEDVICG